MPKISVCIPAYNSALYIGKTIQSVLDQTFQDYELIIGDDTSVDQTQSVVAGFRDPRIRFYQNERNLGLTGNWNSCVARATGEYVLVLCADDLLEKDCLQKKAVLLDQYPSAALACSATKVIDADGAIVMSRRYYKGDRLFDGKWFLRRAFRDRNRYGEPSNVLYRASAAKQSGEFSPTLRYACDLEYWMRLSLKGGVAYTQDCLMSFRISPTSETSRLMRQGFCKLVKDDRDLVRTVRAQREMGVTAMDALCHETVFVLSLLAKYAVLFLKGLLAKRHKEEAANA